MVYLTASTGVGGGVIIGGRLLHGQVSLAEVGHTIIDWTTGASVEDLGSGTALGEKAGEDGAVVTERAKAGGERALAVLQEVAEALPSAYTTWSSASCHSAWSSAEECRRPATCCSTRSGSGWNTANCAPSRGRTSFWRAVAMTWVCWAHMRSGGTHPGQPRPSAARAIRRRGSDREGS